MALTFQRRSVTPMSLLIFTTHFTCVNKILLYYPHRVATVDNFTVFTSLGLKGQNEVKIDIEPNAIVFPPQSQ